MRGELKTPLFYFERYDMMWTEVEKRMNRKTLIISLLLVFFGVMIGVAALISDIALFIIMFMCLFLTFGIGMIPKKYYIELPEGEFDIEE